MIHHNFIPADPELRARLLPLNRTTIKIVLQIKDGPCLKRSFEGDATLVVTEEIDNKLSVMIQLTETLRTSVIDITDFISLDETEAKSITTNAAGTLCIPSTLIRDRCLGT